MARWIEPSRIVTAKMPSTKGPLRDVDGDGELGGSRVAYPTQTGPLWPDQGAGGGGDGCDARVGAWVDGWWMDRFDHFFKEDGQVEGEMDRRRQ